MVGAIVETSGKGLFTASNIHSIIIDLSGFHTILFH